MSRRPHAERPASRVVQGYTLLEVLAALALASVLLLVLFGALRQVTRGWSLAGARLDGAVEPYLVEYQLRRLFTDAVPVASAPAGPLAGEATGVEFVSTLPEQAGASGLHRLRLRLQPPGADAAALVLDFAPWRPGQPADDIPWQSHRLLDAVHEFALDYHPAQAATDAPAWGASWSDPAGLPGLVRLTWRDGAAIDRQWVFALRAPRAPDAEGYGDAARTVPAP